MNKKSINKISTRISSSDLKTFYENETHKEIKEFINSKTNSNLNQNSICLVYKEKNTKNLIPNQDALDLIQKLNGDIAICSIIGQARSGKSFLLSNFYKKLTGFNYNPFEISHQEDSFTKGCWIQKHIPELTNKFGTKMNVILIDTEGLESETYDEQWDTNLFLFNLLLSSMFIYNTKNNLNANDFKKLNIMSNLSNKIKLNTNSSRVEDEKKLRREGPHFVCVVRDFNLTKVKYTPNESMERFLNFEDDKKEENASTRNEIRKSMLNTFREFDCFRLARPVSDITIENKDMEEALQMLDEIAYKRLRKKFRDEFDEMSDWIKENLKPKCIKKTSLNGKLLCEFIKTITNLINKNEIIKIHDTLILSIKSCINPKFDIITKDYLKFLTSIQLPIKSADLNQKNSIKTNELLIRLKNEVNPQSLYPEYEAKLNDYIKNEFEKLEIKNKQEIEAFNRVKSIEIWKQNYSSRVDSLNKVNEFEALLDEFKNNFKLNYQFEMNSLIGDSFWYEIESKINVNDSKEKLRQKEMKDNIRYNESYQQGSAFNTINNGYSGFWYTNDYSVLTDSLKPSSTVHLKKDGSPDMRFRENRIPGYNKDGGLDMRYNVNKRK